MLLVTFGLTLFRDLTEAIVVGFALGAVLFIHRMSQAVAVERGAARAIPRGRRADPARVVYRVIGALFFGAVSAVGAALDRIGDEHRVLVIDFAGVTLVDFSAANMIEGLAGKARRRGVAVYLSGARRRCGASCWPTAAPAAGALRPRHRGGARRRPQARRAESASQPTAVRCASLDLELPGGSPTGHRRRSPWRRGWLAA